MPSESSKLKENETRIALNSGYHFVSKKQNNILHFTNHLKNHSLMYIVIHLYIDLKCDITLWYQPLVPRMGCIYLPYAKIECWLIPADRAFFAPLCLPNHGYKRFSSVLNYM